ncbi:MAG: ribonuclease P protein component 1 [Candidatus Bathyarchaeia archaeon]
MKVTPDIIRCEFIGAEAEVSKSSHNGYVGISGHITDETRNTFTIACHGEKKAVPKGSSTFRFEFPDGTVVEIEGRILVGRPEDRLKKRVRRLW